MSRSFFQRQLGVLPRATEKKTTGAFWRKENPEFDEEGRVDRGGFFSHQLEWWNLPNFIKLLVGGYGSGKTHSVSKRGISSALTNAPYPVAMVSPTYNIARQTTIQTVSEMLEGKRRLLGGRALWWNYNKSSHEFTIKYQGREARLIIYSGDNPLSLRGPNLAAAYIDEPFIQDVAVFEQMIARIRHPDARLKELGLTGTPEQLNWGYELAEGELKDRHDVGYITASTRENLALDDSYANRLEQAYDKKTAEAYVDGKFVNLSTGQVYFNFDPQEHVVRFKIPEGAELGCGMDFNVDPMSAVVFWLFRDRLHIIKEIELPNADTEFMCDYLAENYPTLKKIYPDATGKARSTAAQGKSDYYWIRQAGFQICAKSINPSRRDRYNAVNGKLNPKRGKITLTMDPDCRKLRRYMMQYTYEQMNTPQQKAMSHLLDAAGYPVAFLFPVDKQQFKKKQLRGH